MTTMERRSNLVKPSEPELLKGRRRPELVRELGHLVARALQVGGPRQHALEDRLTGGGEFVDHRDVDLDAGEERVADRGSVAGVAVRVEEQVEPSAPVGRVAESDAL